MVAFLFTGQRDFTETVKPCQDFLRHLPWVSKPGWILPLPASSPTASATPDKTLGGQHGSQLSYLYPLTSSIIDGIRSWNQVGGKSTVKIGKNPLVSRVAFAQCEQALKSIYIKKNRKRKRQRCQTDDREQFKSYQSTKL